MVVTLAVDVVVVGVSEAVTIVFVVGNDDEELVSEELVTLVVVGVEAVEVQLSAEPEEAEGEVASGGAAVLLLLSGVSGSCEVSPSFATSASAIAASSSSPSGSSPSAVPESESLGADLAHPGLEEGAGPLTLPNRKSCRAFTGVAGWRSGLSGKSYTEIFWGSSGGLGVVLVGGS